MPYGENVDLSTGSAGGVLENKNKPGVETAEMNEKWCTVLNPPCLYDVDPQAVIVVTKPTRPTLDDGAVTIHN